MRRIVILGSTGSIGTQAIDVITAHPEEFSVTALAAGGGNLDLAADQAVMLDVELLALARGDRSEVQAAVDQANLRRSSSARPEIIIGADAATTAASIGVDVVLNGITGAIGLRPTLAALEADSTVALANKESLVAGGSLVKRAQRRPDQIVPVDSEHSALAQALRSGRADEVSRLILTASGGPFRGYDRADLADVTPDQALAHPTWAMGPVVTTNSATLINKGLELIEAHVLFDIGLERITTVVHPQSIVHSMVEFIDGSTIAQASPPDMRLPIALGLAWPRRLGHVATPCRWDEQHSWTFEPVDHDTFPAIELCRAAAEASPTHPAVLNAANEECVQAFLAGQLPFLQIIDVIAAVLDQHTGVPEPDLEQIDATQNWARRRANEIIAATVRGSGTAKLHS